MTLAACARCGERPVAYRGRDACYDCQPAKLPARQMCAQCGLNPVGYHRRACCYECVPRKRRAPHLCKRCGSTGIYTSGLCRRCHRMAPLVDSCTDCLAWGVTRHHTWLCSACHGWRDRHHGKHDCPGCGRHLVVNHRGYCRLCTRVATVHNQRRPSHRRLDVPEATREGHQLFFADLILKKRGKQPGGATKGPPGRSRAVWPAGFPVTHEQLVLFTWPRNLNADIVRRLEPPIPALAAVLAQAVDEHSQRHGWSPTQRDMTLRGIRVLLAIQDTPGARITTSEANVLLGVEMASVRPVLDVLGSVDMLHDDRQPPLQAWFDNKVAALPDNIGHEMTMWFRALRDGSTTRPRMRPRKITSVRSQITVVLPTLKRWAAHGHKSLREITRDDIVEALATTDNRTYLLSGLRSMFRYLKAARLIFLNPTSGLRGDPKPPLQLRPIDLDTIRAALNSNDTAQAAITALIAFHALRNAQVRRLQLTDIRDGRVHLEGHSIPLADPVRHRINAWITERARRWPNTANPHLFIHVRTAVRTTEATAGWLNHKIGVPPETIRQDRILHEALTTNGDVRRLCDLFALSIPAAQRYADVFHRPDEHAFTDADDAKDRLDPHTV